MSPAVSEAGVFFGNVYGDPAFYRLDPADGSLIWRQPAPLGVTGSPSTDGARVCFGIGNGDFSMSHANPAGGVVCLAVDDGRTLWRTAHMADAVLTSVALDDGRAFFGSRDGHLYCVGAADGRPLWKVYAGAPVLSSPAVAGGRVCFGCDDGVVRCVRAEDGRGIWEFDTSGEAFNTDARVIGSPAIAGGRVYVGSMNFLFFCLGGKR
jgi:outer membrane protein assembly factor BamB